MADQASDQPRDRFAGGAPRRREFYGSIKASIRHGETKPH